MVFLLSRLWLVHVLDEVVDGGLLAHMAPLRAFRCFGHFNPPEALPASFSGVAKLIAPLMTGHKTAPAKARELSSHV
jgi:hypothetical protein